MPGVSILNPAGVRIDADLIDRLVKEAEIPPPKIKFVFNGYPLPDGRKWPICLPRKMLRFAPAYVSTCGNPRNCNPDDWEVCIVFTKLAGDRMREFPAYFAYQAGHELAHARIWLATPCLHVHCCLLSVDYIGKASGGQITKWGELPQEKRCDQFGIHLSGRLWPRDRLNAEIDVLVTRPDSLDPEKRNWLLSLPSRADLEGLRAELVKFSLPYKAGLIACWEAHRREWGKRSLASLIRNYDDLFK